MNQYELFAGKAYSFALNKEIKEGPNYDLIVKILSDFDESLKPVSIVDSGSNESYDEYLITSEESLFTLKVSLDKDCQVLKNEINFLKENKSLITPKYYSSGLIKSNFSVLFLLTSFEKGLDIDDLGVSYIDSNIKSLLFSLYAFNKLKTSITPEEYFNYFFDNFSVKNGSDFLIENISNNHNIEDIYYVFDQIKDEILSNSLCHNQPKNFRPSIDLSIIKLCARVWRVCVCSSFVHVQVLLTQFRRTFEYGPFILYFSYWGTTINNQHRRCLEYE